MGASTSIGGPGPSRAVRQTVHDAEKNERSAASGYLRRTFCIGKYRKSR